MSGVAVGICTRDRPDAVLRCLRSLALAGPSVTEVIVLDDGSARPVRAAVEPELGASPLPVRWLRNEVSRSVAAGRNQIAAAARAEWLLNLDDDAFLLDAGALERALGVLRSDPTVAAVALAQADATGEPWPPAAQPAPVGVPSQIATFVGYAHLLRRDAFLAMGGFLEALEINGEEKELCLRLLDRGHRVVYLPDARVAHVAAAAGRDPRRYLHQTVRNEVLAAAHSLPFPLWPVLALLRLLRYFPMRRGWGIHDPGGFGVLLGTLRGVLPGVLRARRPVRWGTVRAWRRLTGAPVPYVRPERVA